MQYSNYYHASMYVIRCSVSFPKLAEVSITRYSFLFNRYQAITSKKIIKNSILKLKIFGELGKRK